MTDSATQLPHGGKQPFSGKLVIAVVSLAILTFLGILSETSLNIAYSTLMEEFSIGASVVQWLTTGYLLLLSVLISSSPFMVRKFATKTLFIMAVVIFAAGTLLGALAVNFPMLLAARLVMSLGTGISCRLSPTSTGTKKRDSNMQRPIMTSRSFLRTPSEAAGPGDEQVIEDLVDTLEANRSRCVGMAANMIGVGKRIIVFVDEDLGGRITVMLNPVITASDGAFDTQEGCLSLTGERRTLRYRRIEVNYENRRFRARHATFAGWTAQIIQHEVDHCNGIII